MPAESYPAELWTRIEAEYRAGQLSVREIARRCEISEGAIRKRAAAEGWQRSLRRAVSKAVERKIIASDAGVDPAKPMDDDEIVEKASTRAVEVVSTHRKRIAQLQEQAQILADRLGRILNNEDADGPVVGQKETLADVLLKLTRIYATLIPLERVAYGLNSETETEREGRSADPRDSREARIQRLNGKLTLIQGGGGRAA